MSDAALHDGDDELLARVRRKVMAAVQAEPRHGLATVRREEGPWETIGPGVTRKLLWVSGNSQSALVRLEAGASVPGHGHQHDEECVVLEGSLCIGDDVVLHAGDFHVGARGSRHAPAMSPGGALVYLRGALETA